MSEDKPKEMPMTMRVGLVKMIRAVYRRWTPLKTRLFLRNVRVRLVGLIKRQDEYTPNSIAVCQMVWGDGFLSPGGEAHLDKIVAGLDLQDKLTLDIGCALGGFDVLLAKKYGAQVIGLDVEAHLLDHGRKRVVDAGLSDRIDLQLYDPGPLPFPNEKFDVVFSKEIGRAHV